MTPPESLITSPKWRVTVALVCLAATTALGTVPTGDEATAKKYYAKVSKTLGYSTPEQIFSTTLDNVTAYLGYRGLTGADLQNLPPTILMNLAAVVGPCTADGGACDGLGAPQTFIATFAFVPIRPDDILVTRFFAPKIMNIREPEATRPNGWRKLVRLRARIGSPAAAHGIAEGVILFNIFTPPDRRPFLPGDESVNTQVMLVTQLSRLPPPNTPGPDAIYWLDYDKLSDGGKLSLALVASFDANELPQSTAGTRPYFVPDGCNGCHGANPKRAMINYLDTDHWFDRLDTDFIRVRDAGLPLLVDADTNDVRSPAYIHAFDAVRRFNEGADEQAQKALPRHDEVLTSRKWLELHALTTEHATPIDRAVGAVPRWDRGRLQDVGALDALNQYCFRCHGSVNFSVFNKQSVLARWPKVRSALAPDAGVGVRMPPDRELPPEARDAILAVLPGGN